MPYYSPLKKLKSGDRSRIVGGLERIRTQLEEENFPSKKATESLILGTWNLRNFDDDRFNYGNRTTESMYYIAEIISRFDVIAVQEICTDLWPLKQLMNILGRNTYDYIVTDVSHSGIGGNQERLGFIYNKSKVRFTGVAGEIVLPDRLLISEVATKKRQFSRTPFGVEFQSEWFKFYFSTVHIYFGSNSNKSIKYKRRVDEISMVAKYLAKEAKNSDANHILVGDFNIKAVGSAGFNALEKNGFTVIKNREGSNRDQTKFYDQISFRSKKNELALLEPNRDDRVFQFFNSVYRKEDYKLYKPIMKKMMEKKLAVAKDLSTTGRTKKIRGDAAKQVKSLTEALRTETNMKAHYEEWRTFQMSDHLPLWVEIKINFSQQYLDYIKSLD